MPKMLSKQYDDYVWYLCGPMSGIDQFNVPTFLSEKDRLEDLGVRVQLPADLDDPATVEALLMSDGTPGDSEMTWGECLAMDVRLICDHCDGVLVLSGWEKSKGARLETFTAFLQNKPIFSAKTLRPISMSVLYKAWLAQGTWRDRKIPRTYNRYYG